MPDALIPPDAAAVLAIDAAVLGSTGGGAFGVTPTGFVVKPFARLLAEKLALARALFGDDVDLTSGSAIRKLLEVSALEDARTWAAVGAVYDNAFVSSATGEALGRLGEELGLPRPFLEARGTVRVKLAGALPAGVAQLEIPRGTRLLTPGGHHAATDETVVLSAASSQREVPVVAFYPGPEHNLNPATASQKLNRWNPEDPALPAAVRAAQVAGTPLVAVEHTAPLSGGELRWSDARYRQLLLRAPRSLWTTDAIRVAVSLVPGVRQVQVHDRWGGLDLHQSVFGNFNFIERVFSSERDLGTPYYFSVLVAPTPAAIWEGGYGLRAAAESAIEELRPVGIFPQVTQAEEVGIGVSARLVVSGIPLPGGPKAAVNASEAAAGLKVRLMERIRQYVDTLGFGEPVRAAEVTWAMMNEPGVADVQDLRLLRAPPPFAAGSTATAQTLALGENATLQPDQIAVFVDAPARLSIV